MKLPLAETGRLLPPLSCKTKPVPASPETLPPIVYVAGGGGGGGVLLEPPPHAAMQRVAAKVSVNRQGFTGSSTSVRGMDSRSLGRDFIAICAANGIDFCWSESGYIEVVPLFGLSKQKLSRGRAAFKVGLHEQR